jgi:hypothetical protein
MHRRPPPARRGTRHRILDGALAPARAAARVALPLLALAACVTALVPGSARAQTATIDVVVTEAGAPVAERDIELRDIASGRRLPLRTNSQGVARSAALPAAGEYEVWIDGERRLAAQTLRSTGRARWRSNSLRSPRSACRHAARRSRSTP